MGHWLHISFHVGRMACHWCQLKPGWLFVKISQHLNATEGERQKAKLKTEERKRGRAEEEKMISFFPSSAPSRLDRGLFGDIGQ